MPTMFFRGVENVEIMLILPLVQLRIKIGITPVPPLVQLKSCGKPSLLILLTGGMTGQIRRTRGIRTLSTSTLVKHCGLMGGTTPIGLPLNWQFWTREWVLCKTVRESQFPLCMLMTSGHPAPTLKSLFEGGNFAIPN